jgi:hypothetical protein
VNDFDYIAFDKNTGAQLAYGRSHASARHRAKFSEVEPSTIIVLRCGKAGSYVWAEALNVERAANLIKALIIA